MRPETTLRIYPLSDGRFEIREEDRVLGTSQNEMMAVWTAVEIARQIARSGKTARVVAVRNGTETEEYVAKATSS